MSENIERVVGFEKMARGWLHGDQENRENCEGMKGVESLQESRLVARVRWVRRWTIGLYVDATIAI